MPEPYFKSSLSIEEIENNFNDVDIFSGIMDALIEAHSFVKAKTDNKGTD